MIFPRLRDLREDHDLLQKDIAAYLNCSQVSYSYYEIGLRNIPIECLIKLARFYHTSVDYLLGLTDQKKPYTAHHEKRSSAVEDETAPASKQNKAAKESPDM